MAKAISSVNTSILHLYLQICDGLIAKTITSHDIQWIYYPRKEHFESFDRGVRELKRAEYRL